MFKCVNKFNNYSFFVSFNPSDLPTPPLSKWKIPPRLRPLMGAQWLVSLRRVGTFWMWGRTAIYSSQGSHQTLMYVHWQLTSKNYLIFPSLSSKSAWITHLSLQNYSSHHQSFPCMLWYQVWVYSHPWDILINFIKKFPQILISAVCFGQVQQVYSGCLL